MDIFLGILRHKVTCSDSSVVDVAQNELVDHLEDNLLEKFKDPWKAMNRTLPWQQHLVTIRKESPNFQNYSQNDIF